METLRQYTYMAEKLDTGLEAQINHIAIGDPERAKVLQEDILYPVRRRRQEILTQLAVAVQGYAALRVVEINNRELVRAVRTATTTTVAALRTAVMVAQALTNQKLVSEQVKAVNETTSAMIESTSSVLREQTATVESQAASPGIDMGSLQRAWDNVFAALDQIDTYKLRALEAMKITVRDLSDQVEKSHAQVERLHSADATASTRRRRAGPPPPLSGGAAQKWAAWIQTTPATAAITNSAYSAMSSRRRSGPHDGSRHTTGAVPEHQQDCRAQAGVGVVHPDDRGTSEHDRRRPGVRKGSWRRMVRRSVRRPSRLTRNATANTAREAQADRQGR